MTQSDDDGWGNGVVVWDGLAADTAGMVVGASVACVASKVMPHGTVGNDTPATSSCVSDDARAAQGSDDAAPQSTYVCSAATSDIDEDDVGRPVVAEVTTDNVDRAVTAAGVVDFCCAEAVDDDAPTTHVALDHGNASVRRASAPTGLRGVCDRTGAER